MKRFLKSCSHAFQGIHTAYAHEKNLQIQLVISVIVIATALCLKITRIEWCVILICNGLVHSFELLNTALEKLCDHVHPEHHSSIKIIKDISAAAVVFVSIISVLVGLVIFSPYVFF